MGAFEQTVGLIPITGAAGITLAYKEAMLDTPRHRRSRQGAGRRPRRRPLGQCRTSRRGRASSVGFGDFSNVGL